MRQLTWIPVGETHAMASCEEQRRGVAATKVPAQASFVGLVFEQCLDAPARLILDRPRGQRFDQLVRGELSREVAGVLNAEEDSPPGQRQLAGLRRYHAVGVARVLVERVEMNPADRVLHLELVLKGERD